MRYVIALIVMFMWGGLQFASAQDKKDCSSPASTEGKTMSDDASAKGNDEAKADDNMKVNSESESDYKLEGQCPQGASMDTTVSSETSSVTTTEEKEHSALGKIVRAPIKFIGNIPKAGVSLVSETLEGTAHIVGAPFKAVGKLFGREEDDSNNKRKKRMEVENATHTQVIEKVDTNVNENL